METIFQTMLRDHDRFLKELSDVSEVIFGISIKAETPEEKLEVLRGVLEVYLKLSKFIWEFDKHWHFTLNSFFVLSEDSTFLGSVEKVKEQREILSRTLSKLQELLAEYREMKRSIEEITTEVKEAIMKVRLTLLEHIIMEERLILHLIMEK